MKKILRSFSIFLGFALLYFLKADSIYAVCPVCTVAVVGGVGLSRYLGVDDTITGIWIGGLMVSSSFWLADWTFKKNFKFLQKLGKPTITYLSVLLMSLFIFVPLWTADIVGHPLNRILGIDKLVFGSLVGTAVFLLGVWLDKKERQIKGKQLFNFQRVIFPLLSLIIASAITYLSVTKKI